MHFRLLPVSCLAAQKCLPFRLLPALSTEKSDSDELHVLLQSPELLTPHVMLRFEVMAKVIRFFSPTFFIFLLFYSLISITLKVYTIDKISIYPLLSLVTYISTSFALHDIVQIRISCAIAIFLFSIRFLVERKYLIYVLLISIAVCFHKSSAAFFIFLFFRKNSFHPVFWILTLIVIYVSAFFNINFIKLFLLVLGEDNYYYISIISDMNQNLDLFKALQTADNRKLHKMDKRIPVCIQKLQ